MAMEETAKALLKAGDLLGDSIAKSANPEQYAKTSAVLRELREAVQERSTEGLLDQIVVAVAFYGRLASQDFCLSAKLLGFSCGINGTFFGSYSVCLRYIICVFEGGRSSPWLSLGANSCHARRPYTKQLSHLVRQPICFFVRMISIWTCGRGSS